jgi:predicted DNA-binding transcriptional regulator AlpA
MIQRGDFPRAVKISLNAVGFRRRDVLKFLRERRDA